MVKTRTESVGGKNSTKCVHQNYFKKAVRHWYQRSSSGSNIQMPGLSTITKRLNCKAGGKLRFPNYSDRSKRKRQRQNIKKLSPPQSQMLQAHNRLSVNQYSVK